MSIGVLNIGVLNKTVQVATQIYDFLHKTHVCIEEEIQAS